MNARKIDIFFILLNSQPLNTTEILEKINLYFDEKDSPLLGVREENFITYINRDIKYIKKDFEVSRFLKEHFSFEIIKTPKKLDKYSVHPNGSLSHSAALVLIKLLIASRALNDAESTNLIDGMEKMYSPEKARIMDFAVNEPSQNHASLAEEGDRVEKVWKLERFMTDRQGKNISFDYTDHETHEIPKTSQINMFPVHVFFNNYYFFLVGYVQGEKVEDGHYLTCRIDWMGAVDFKAPRPYKYDSTKNLNHGTEDGLNIFGYRGEIMHLKFLYYGYPGYIKDKFPSLEEIKQVDLPNQFDFPVRLMKMDVHYSDGVKLWLLGESTILTVIEPQSLAADLEKTLLASANRYQDVNIQKALKSHHYGKND